jgi:hypothetical protein
MPLSQTEGQAMVSQQEVAACVHELASTIDTNWFADDDASIACEIPGCETTEAPTCFGDNTNIKCAQCHHFTCSLCTDRIWKGKWSDETFPKPRMIFTGMVHQVFTCPFCRASFDRIVKSE